MKYKIGDVVTIKNDLNINMGSFINKDMIQFRGQKGTIVAINKDSYRITECGFWNWYDYMLDDNDYIDKKERDNFSIMDLL